MKFMVLMIWCCDQYCGSPSNVGPIGWKASKMNARFPSLYYKAQNAQNCVNTRQNREVVCVGNTKACGLGRLPPLPVKQRNKKALQLHKRTRSRGLAIGGRRGVDARSTSLRGAKEAKYYCVCVTF
ncbi:hypothetical protein AVEN_32692-1 [Araneus ventricosus]|uniref:Uncharacterized protein n=1 Tax=Araneus ventricosus TaxID=182803 RepID=A0A4Y2W4R4_ARAVE|nr:hypothetical protein AVEN_32692-1 [Araneus ventricosus]